MNNSQMNLKKWVMVHKITTTKKKKFVWYKTTHFLGRLFIWPQSWTKRINPKHNQYFGVIHLTQLFRSNEYPKKIFQIDQIGVISVNFDPPFFSFIWPIKLLETNNPQNKPNVFHDFFRFLFFFSSIHFTQKVEWNWPTCRVAPFEPTTGLILTQPLWEWTM